MDELTKLFKNGTGIPHKIVVFDLDETLGYFVVFGMFCNALETFYKRPLTQMEFNLTLDLYPEFLRPNIIGLLAFLKHKKDTNKCNKLVIYTNNNGPDEWVILIKSYFEWKIGGVIFDRIIPAFKVGGVSGRTTNRKTYADFIKCSNAAFTSQICFIDDMFYSEMNTSNIYYILVRPYIYDLTYSVIIRRYIEFHESLKFTHFESRCMTHFNKYNHVLKLKTEEEYQFDIDSTKYMLKHVNRFFNQSNTRRARKRRITKTKKVHK